MLKKALLSALMGVACLATQAQNVTTYIGSPGTPGYNTTTANFSTARFTEPYGIAFDSSGTLLYISEQGSHRIRLITLSDNAVYTRAGSIGDPATAPSYLQGTGTSSRFNTPQGIAVAPNGDIYVADQQNHAIRKITKFTSAGSGQPVTTFAGESHLTGSGIGAYQNGQGTNARFDNPMDIAIDASGNLYVADGFNDCIRKIDPAGNVTLFAGSPGSFGLVNGAATSAQFYMPVAVEFLDNNTLLVADANNRVIRKIDLTTMQVSTFAGSGNQGGTDGAALSADFSTPNGLAVDAFGNVFVADGRSGQANTIRIISNGQVKTIAGTYGEQGTKDGQDTSSRWNFPGHLAFNKAKNELFITDVLNHTIRRVDMKPIADFSTFATTVNVNVEVPMTNTSLNSPTAYFWEITPAAGWSFTSGTNASSLNPKITFTASGVYTVKLTATNAYGAHAVTKNNYINVSNTGGGNAPIADFDASRTVTSINDTVVFTDKSTNQPINWEWTITPSTFQYVDGTGSGTQNPKVQFTQNGIYTVSLKASNPLGNNTKTRANYIHIFPAGIETVTLDDLINVYPNPATNGKLTVDLGRVPVSNTLTVAVFDITGRAVYEQIFLNNPGKLELNLEGKAKGIYFVTVYDGHNKVNKTVVVE